MSRTQHDHISKVVAESKEPVEGNRQKEHFSLYIYYIYIYMCMCVWGGTALCNCS